MNEQNERRTTQKWSIINKIDENKDNNLDSIILLIDKEHNNLTLIIKSNNSINFKQIELDSSIHDESVDLSHPFTVASMNMESG